jgi:hypothetical protein
MANTEVSIRRAFAVGNVLLAAVFIALLATLPARYAVVDIALVALSALALASAVGVWNRGNSWGLRVLRASALGMLLAGLAAISALALGVSYLSGVYGELARTALGFWIGGSLLLLPYLVIYPLLQLLWLHAQRRRGIPGA